jgi:pimeloyl-ACP methyl ester carboxylesterase
MKVQALSQAGYHVLAPDMLGYGQSDKTQQPEPYGLASIVSGLVELLDHQHLQQVHVVGHDW